MRLHDPVFQRMKSDQERSPSLPEEQGERVKEIGERAKLVIYLDPDRLEAAGRRVMLPLPTLSRRQRRLDRCRKRACVSASLIAPALDRPGNRSREWLLPIALEGSPELFKGAALKPLSGALPGEGIHPHINGSCAEEGEPSRRLI